MAFSHFHGIAVNNLGLCIKIEKSLINPYYISSEEYVKRWEQVTYEKKAFAEGTVETKALPINIGLIDTLIQEYLI